MQRIKTEGVAISMKARKQMDDVTNVVFSVSQVWLAKKNVYNLDISARLANLNEYIPNKDTNRLRRPTSSMLCCFTLKTAWSFSATNNVNTKSHNVGSALEQHNYTISYAENLIEQ